MVASPSDRSPLDARSYAVERRLADGAPVLIRAIRREHRERLHAGFHRLSERSIYLRFFQAKRDLSDDELTRLTDVDFVRHVALVAVLPEEKNARGVVEISIDLRK